MKTTREKAQNEPAATLNAEAVQRFANQIRGDLIASKDESYDEARAVWNGLIKEFPEACLGVKTRKV